MKCLSLLLLILSVSAQAGIFEGNAGAGVSINGKTYLFDLWEIGIHENVYFNREVKVEPFIQERINKKFYHKYVSKEVKQLVALKLTEIYRRTPLTAQIILRAFEMFQWGFTPRKLKKVDLPEEDTDIDLEGLELFNLAIRGPRSISINSKFWDKKASPSDLDAANQTALLFHEVIYAFNPKANRATRKFIGILFSEAFSKDHFSPEFFEIWTNRLGLPIAYEQGKYKRFRLKDMGKTWFAPDFYKEVVLGVTSNLGEFWTKIPTTGSQRNLEQQVQSFCQKIQSKEESFYKLSIYAGSSGKGYRTGFRTRQDGDRIDHINGNLSFYDIGNSSPLAANDPRIYVEPTSRAHPDLSYQRNVVGDDLEPAMQRDCQSFTTNLVKKFLARL